MKRLTIALLIFLSAICTSAKEPLKILAIGNSFSMDAVEQNLHEIGEAAGVPMYIVNMYIGGCSIDTHVRCMLNDSPSYDKNTVGLDGVRTSVKGVRLSEVIGMEEWDIISVQQASGYSGLYDSYSKLPQLVEWIHENAPSARVVFHMTWAYSTTSTHKHFPWYDNDQLKMYNAIEDAAARACKDNGIKILIPSGRAIQIARGTSLGDDLTRDGYHLDLKIGRYIAAATWFETLTGKSIMNNSYCPEGIDRKDWKIAKKSVHKACRQR